MYMQENLLISCIIVQIVLMHKHEIKISNLFIMNMNLSYVNVSFV